MGVIQRLFVYGTLAPGRPNAHILAPLAGAWQPATVRGHLQPQGWGTALGFPGIVLSAEGEEVSGLIFSAQELASFWPILDAFEGEQYERVLTDVTLPEGETLPAYIYVLRQE
jgi:gamma-glutamylcyclotransferase (GGCT)/AIG2-like uncharacterized protein YtfP